MTDSTHYDLASFLLNNDTMEADDTDIDSDEEDDDVIFDAPGAGQTPEPEVDLNDVLEENNRVEAQLHNSPGQLLREKVSRILDCISQEGLDLPTVLDSILWKHRLHWRCKGEVRKNITSTKQTSTGNHAAHMEAS